MPRRAPRKFPVTISTRSEGNNFATLLPRLHSIDYGVMTSFTVNSWRRSECCSARQHCLNVGQNRSEETNEIAEDDVTSQPSKRSIPTPQSPALYVVPPRDYVVYTEEYCKRTSAPTSDAFSFGHCPTEISANRTRRIKFAFSQ